MEELQMKLTLNAREMATVEREIKLINSTNDMNIDKTTIMSTLSAIFSEELEDKVLAAIGIQLGFEQEVIDENNRKLSAPEED